MKIVFLIIASNDKEHELDLLTQRNTWASNLPENIKVISLRGWNKDLYSFESDNLYVPCPEEYSQILRKTILGVKYLVRELEFDILIRSNVSTYFDIASLLRELKNPVYTSDFVGGYFDRTSAGYFDNTSWFEYISGTGIFMSRNAAVKLSGLDEIAYTGIADDVAIDDFFRKSSLPRIRMERNNLGSTHLFLPSFHIRAKSSTDSFLASKRMNLIHEYFTSVTVLSRVRVYISICISEFMALIKHPEPFYYYLAKNRVVLLSYLKMKRGRL